VYGKPDYDPMADAHRCEICGKWYRALVRHVPRAHKITIAEYKKRWGINMNEPLMGETLRARLREKAYETGVNKNLEAGIYYRFKSGENTYQSYKRMEQTKRRLRVLKKISKKRKKS